MHTRAILLAGLFAIVAISGCVETSEPGSVAQPIVDTTVGQNPGHPAYGYPTNAQLPVSEDGLTRVEQADGSIQWFRPAARPLPATLTGIEAVAEVKSEASTAGGIAIHGPLAVYGNRGSGGGMAVVDLSNPEAPVTVGFSADTPVRDADFIQYPDGQLVVITTAGGGDQYATDVTDPANPELIATFDTEHGNHNIAVVPGTPLVYNSGSGGVIDIVDYTDPLNPVAVGTFQNDNGCHDITFFMDPAAEKYRAYCAGYGESQIWDITDPKAPEMVTRISYPSLFTATTGEELPAGNDQAPDFPLSFSHLAMPNHDGTVLIVGDETGGGGINGCDTYQETGGQTTTGPLGNLYFYDISDETNPVLHGAVSPEAYDDPTDPNGSCTSHFGRVIEDTGFLVMAFYTSGVLLVDFNDLDNPRIVDRYVSEGSDVWDVQYHQGYLVTGDIGRGMDILTLA